MKEIAVVFCLTALGLGVRVIVPRCQAVLENIRETERDMRITGALGLRGEYWGESVDGGAE